jgi:flavorubredoxin
MAEAVEDAFRYGRLVLATTTYNNELFPFMREFLHELTERNYQNRTVGIIENGSWAPTAAKHIKAMLAGSKNITFTDTVVTLRSAMTDANRAEIAALAREICQ